MTWHVSFEGDLYNIETTPTPKLREILYDLRHQLRSAWGDERRFLTADVEATEDELWAREREEDVSGETIAEVIDIFGKEEQ